MFHIKSLKDHTPACAFNLKPCKEVLSALSNLKVLRRNWNEGEKYFLIKVKCLAQSLKQAVIHYNDVSGNQDSWVTKLHRIS